MRNSSHLSSDYLFHFTGCLENIISILKEGLQVNRCNEDFSFLKNVKVDEIEDVFRTSNKKERVKEKNFNVSVPMICFCDIPINQTYKHSEVYGNYALGFDKSWGIKRGINPVSYLVSQSDLATAIRALNKETSEIPCQSPDYIIRNQFVKIASYLKLYEGYFKKGDYENKKHRFYDEREWRYLPSGYNVKIAPAKLIHEQENLCQFDSAILLSDVKYIIVKEKNEKSELKNLLKEEGIQLSKETRIEALRKP